MSKILSLGPLKLKADDFLIMAGPCVIEDRDFVLKTAETLQGIAAKHGFPYVFKSSYDKANRTSLESFRGVGVDEGLKILQEVKTSLGLPVVSDVHSAEEATISGEVLDVLQIPAFLCRQTDLLIAAGKTGKVVNIKKGQFLAPWDMEHVAKKVSATGNEQLMLTERGASFGYNNLVSDMRSLLVMRQWGYRVIFDATHSVQLPGGGGSVSSGQREYVLPLARGAVAVGCDGLFLEVHPNPSQAPSDGPNMLDFAGFDQLLLEIKTVLEALSAFR